MKKISLLMILVILIPISLLRAQDIITAQEVAKIMKNDNVILVSTRTTSDYKQVHITGAVNVNHTDLYTDGPVKNMLKSPAEIATILGANGISESKEIILYDDGTGKYAGRMYWIISYLGAKNVKILTEPWMHGKLPESQ